MCTVEFCIYISILVPITNFTILFSLLSGHPSYFRGMGRLYLVEGMMKQQQYLEVLRHGLFSQTDHCFEGTDWIFQHDLAPYHTARSIQTFLQNN